MIRPGGLGHINSDFTGTGVRSAFELVQSLIKTER
jgi:hypothetical protein